MSKVLIYEKLNDVKTLEKGRGEDGFMRLKGVFGVCGVRNNNQRVYSLENYRSMVDRIKSRIVSEGVPGQLEHPQSMNIDLNEVSHVIESIDIDEKGVVTGSIKLLNTPKGKIAQALVEGGLPLFISSRAAGQIDKNGNVTLEDLKTYDLVGTPGFSQARLNLAESAVVKSELGEGAFISESSTDDTIIIESKETKETNKDNNTMVTEQEYKDLLDKVDVLERKLSKMNSRIDEVNSPERMTKLANAIQNWIINEYSPQIDSFISEAISQNSGSTIKKEVLEQLAEGIEKWTINEVAPNIQRWITEEYGKHIAEGIQKWMIEEHDKSFADGIQGWMINEMAPSMQGWMVSEMAPTIEKWITEEYSGTVDKWFNEHVQPTIMNDVKDIRESKEQKLASIDSILEMLDQTPAKPVIGRVNENVDPNEPLYIREMPASSRPLYESADENMKNFIARKARLYNFNNPEAIDRFWESIDWKKDVKSTPINEELEQYANPYERNLRLSLRRHSLGNR